MSRALLIAVALLLAPGSSLADLTVDDNDRELRHECSSDDTVTINGNRIRLTLTGGCKLVLIVGNENRVSAITAVNLAVSGNENHVTAEQTDRIYVPGNDNRVDYARAVTRKKPRISNPGNRNRIRKKP